MILVFGDVRVIELLDEKGFRDKGLVCGDTDHG